MPPCTPLFLTPTLNTPTFLLKLQLWLLFYVQIEGSRPEWCIPSLTYTSYSGDTPFWLETLEIKDA